MSYFVGNDFDMAIYVEEEGYQSYHSSHPNHFFITKLIF